MTNVDLDFGAFYANKTITTNYVGKSLNSPLTYFDGTIDDLRFYNRRLSASEVTFLMTGKTNANFPKLTAGASGPTWSPKPEIQVDATETSYTVKSNEIALTPGTNSTYAVWTSPKTSNIRVDVSFADYHSRSSGVGFQMFKINSDNTFGSVIFPRTVTSTALTNVAPTNYLTVPSSNILVNAGDQIIYRIDANGNPTSASSVISTRIFTENSIQDSISQTTTNLSGYITSVDASLSAIRTSIQQVSSTGSIQDPSINDLITYNGTQDSNITAISNSLSTYLLKSAFDSSMNTNYYAKSVIDGSINSALGSYALSSSLNNYYLKTDTDSSINNVLGSYARSSTLSNYYLKTDTDSSINNVLNSYSTKGYVDDRFTTLVGTISTDKLDTLAEIANALQGDASFGITVYGRINSCDSSINVIRASLSSYATNNAVDSSLALYYTKNAIDASINGNIYNKTSIDASINTLLGFYSNKSAIDSSLALYYTKNAIDASINGNIYNKTSIDASINTLLGFYSNKSAIDSSLALYYTKLDIDASINGNIYNKRTIDSSINTLLGFYSNKSVIDSSLSLYYTKLAIDASINGNIYNKTSIDASINTVLSFYLRTGSLADISLSGNVQLGGGSKNISINKTPNALFALDISGDLDVNGNSYFGTGNHFVGINKQTPTVALDISGTTNMSGNLALTKASAIPMGSFDLSAVNMSVFNVSEKFTPISYSATPTLDYSTGGIFYMSAVSGALTTISITNVPTTLNRSISVTLMLAQSGGSGTNCFTTGTLNINGTSVAYLKPDATALAVPAAARSLIINQFIIIWASATANCIAYLSSMG